MLSSFRDAEHDVLVSRRPRFESKPSALESAAWPYNQLSNRQHRVATLRTDALAEHGPCDMLKLNYLKIDFSFVALTSILFTA